MKTDDLITGLALDLAPTRRGQLELRLLGFMLPAAAMVMVGILAGMGLRSDLAAAVTGPTFWLKAAYTLALGATGFWMLDRLGRPGRSARGPVVLLGLIVGVAMVWAGIELARAAPADRMGLMMGISALVCPVYILALFALSAPFIFFAARRFAPVRPRAAGAAAGLVSAGLATTLYGLHCPEYAAAFVALWYSLGIALSVGAGALIGKVAFRW